jgi:hypothetical protein
MSVACQQSIKLSVVAGSLLYWSFDNVAAGNFIDNSLGAVLTPLGFPTIAGFIANGVKFINGASNLTADLSPSGTPKLSSYNQGGVSHCFWARMDVKSGGFPSELVATVLDGADGHQYEFSFRPGLGGFFDNIPLTIIQDPNLLGPTVLTVNVPIVWVVGVWNFFAFIYDNTTGKLSVSSNNGAPAVSAGSFILPKGTWNNIHPNVGIISWPIISMDEYMIHTGKALNATQITSLYNGGSGVTWPAAGTIVS